MSKRGGRRPGAGRKPILGAWDRIAVGSKCEAVLNLIAESRKDQRRQEDLSETSLPEYWQWVKSIPIAERKAWGGSKDAKLHSEVVKDELRAMRPNPIDGRYGIRSRVLLEVSVWASEQYGVKLKSSFIEDCWEQYRSLFPDV